MIQKIQINKENKGAQTEERHHVHLRGHVNLGLVEPAVLENGWRAVGLVAIGKS